MTSNLPGYYWVRRRQNSEPTIARLTKNSGWFHFDGSHVKMVPTKPEQILKRIDDYKEEKNDT